MAERRVPQIRLAWNSVFKTDLSTLQHIGANVAKDKVSELNGVAKLYEARQLAEKGIAPSDPEFRDRWPNLFSILTCCKVTEDRVIDPPSLRLSNSSGDWCVSLAVGGIQAYGEVMVKTFAEAFDAVERALVGGMPFWKHNLRKPTKDRPLKKQK
jgi:hypothetical protein